MRRVCGRVFICNIFRVSAGKNRTSHTVAGQCEKYTEIIFNLIEIQ